MEISKITSQPNWKGQSLESLEKDFWNEPTEGSYLVKTCHALRKKPLGAFEIEDLRIMIGQNIGLKYLIPSAISVLKNNVLAEGDLYEGDLLKAVLDSNPEFWKTEKHLYLAVCMLFKQNITQIESEAKAYKTGREIIRSFQSFEKINP